MYIFIVIARSIVELHLQQTGGYLFGTAVLSVINNTLYLNIIDFVAVILLQINEVQVIMRIFLRQRDKRMTLVVGLLACFLSQIIWAITKFHLFPDESEAGDILPTFIYLTRIAMASCYAALISVFLVLKISYIVANRHIWLLSLLTFIVLYSPVAFFVADVSNAFIYDLSEIFSVVNYVLCVVIPWEWCNKFNLIMKAKEKDGVLGRRFYEDETYELNQHELFVEEGENEDDNDNDNDNDNNGNNNGHRPAPHKYRPIHRAKPTQFQNAKKTLMSLDRTKEAFVSITDTIIAKGFAVPRSVSAASSPFKNRQIPLQDLSGRGGGSDSRPGSIANTRPGGRTNTRTDTSNIVDLHDLHPSNNDPARTRRDVFVYSTKQVVLDFSDDDNA